MGKMASQITSLAIVYSIVYSGADQRKRQSSASLAFVSGIHQGPVKSTHKGPVTWKMFPFDDVIMCVSEALQRPRMVLQLQNTHSTSVFFLSWHLRAVSTSDMEFYCKFLSTLKATNRVLKSFLMAMGYGKCLARLNYRLFSKLLDLYLEFFSDICYCNMLLMIFKISVLQSCDYTTLYGNR